MSTSTSTLGGFVSRSGSSLIDPSTNTTLRFISFNTPTLHLHDDPAFVVPTEYEQDDVLSSIVQFGGRVVRTYVLGVQRQKEDPSTATKHIVKQGSSVGLNERVFVGLDRALSVANQKGVRVIIPLIDRWEWWGGVESFVKLHNPSLPASAFYSDPTIRTSFKNLIQQVLTRVNTMTNVTYRDDPTILAWETGNELEIDGGRVPTDWTLDIAAHIKSIDKNHLVMDGSWKHGWDEKVLSDGNVDIFSNHYYRYLSFSTGEWVGLGAMSAGILLALLLASVSLCAPRRLGWMRLQNGSKPRFSQKRRLVTVIMALLTLGGLAGGIAGIVLHRIPNPRYGAAAASDASLIASRNKVFIAGEYGLASVESLRGMMDQVVKGQPGLAGALLWSLRGHHRDGGFYVHSEMHGYSSYHHPGFPASSGFGSDEQSVVQTVANYASRLADQTNFKIPQPSTLPPPTLLNTSTPALRWQGVAGAFSYDVERSSNGGSGEWTTVGKEILDNKKPGSVLYQDSGVGKGRFGYRVRGRNAVGLGEPSNVLVIDV